MRIIWTLLMLSACAARTEPSAPLERIILVPPDAIIVDPPATNSHIPNKIRESLAKAIPRENALVARSDRDQIALVRELHRNVQKALWELENKPMTQASIRKAAIALADLENHLNEMNVSSPPPIELKDELP